MSWRWGAALPEQRRLAFWQGRKLSIQQPASQQTACPRKALVTVEPCTGGLEVLGLALPLLPSGAGEPLAVVWMKRQRVP